MELFDSGIGEPLPVVDAQLVLWKQAGFGDDRELLARLIQETPWKLEYVTLWGKTYPQPRLVAWYGDDSISYSYSGIDLTALPWTPMLQRIKGIVEARCDYPFNSVLLNYYRDHRDGMGFHADDEPELGAAPVIASVSFGETRSFILKHKFRREISNVKIPLTSGSLLLMTGATQANWKHGIPKQSKHCGPRVNLTFRKISG
ncbi:MAG: alpha-ketoglutarate-dependent dioxygenase AlkB [Halioglobus sp.]